MNSTINGINCNPLGIREASIKETLKEGEIFNEKTFDGELTFYGSDYDYLITLDEFADVEFKVNQSSLIVTAYFNRAECVINTYQKTIKVNPKIQNNYETILKEYDKEYNVYSLPINRDEIQINRTNLTTKTVTIPLQYPEHRFIGFKNTSNHTIDFENGKEYFLYNGSEVLLLDLPFNTVIDIKYFLYSVEFEITSTITANSIYYQDIGNATFSKRYTGEFKCIYKRRELLTYDSEGEPVNPDNSLYVDTNIVDANGLRTWAANPYVNYTLSNVAVHYSDEFNLYITGFTLFSESFQLRNNLNLLGIVTELFNKIDSSLVLNSNILQLGNLSTPYSDYITDMNNAGLGSFTSNLTNNIINKLYVNTVSNCMNPEATEPDANENISLKKILELLKQMFNIYWKIDGNFFILEHYSYFKNGSTQSKEIYLKEEINIENPNQVDKTTFEYSQNYFNLFKSSEINNDLTVINDNAETKNIILNVDFGSMYNRSKNISEDGFTFILKDTNNGIFTQNKNLSLFNLLPTYHLVNQTKNIIKSKYYNNGEILDCSYNTMSIIKKYKLEAFTDNQVFDYIDINQDINTDYGLCEIIETDYNLGLEKYNLILNIKALNL